ncbi:hypothetical protein N0V86_009254, partial [Didymella sp. IMI 355093]
SMYKDLSLHRDEEEDLIDYGDSDAEAETSNNQETTAAVAIEDIDIFADDTTHAEVPAESEQPCHSKVGIEESTGEPEREAAEKSTKKSAEKPAAEPVVPVERMPPPTTSKTMEAAAVIKNLNELLTDPDFRVALGLVEAGSTLDLGFWADSLDFALSLKLVGAAEVKICKYGPKCRNKKCTFDHGDADSTAFVTVKKPRKLCSVINTPTGCSKGDACWFSHEAFGVACADGDLRATCVKGIYCVYKHNDDEVVASVEQVDNAGETNETEAPAQSAPPVYLTTETKPETAPPTAPAPAPSRKGSPKQQARGVKRRRETDEETEDENKKVPRIGQRRSRQEQAGGRGRRRSFVPERAGSKNDDQGHRDSRSRCRGSRDGRGGGVEGAEEVGGTILTARLRRCRVVGEVRRRISLWKTV